MILYPEMKFTLLVFFLSTSMTAGSIASASCGTVSNTYSASINCPDGTYASAHTEGPDAQAEAYAGWGSLWVSAVATGRNGERSYADAYATTDLGWFRFFGGKGQAIAAFSVSYWGSDYGDVSVSNGYLGDFLYVNFIFGVPFHLEATASAWAGDSGYDTSISSYSFYFGEPYMILNDEWNEIYAGKWYYDNGNTAVPEPSTFALIGLSAIFIYLQRLSTK